MTLKQTDIKLTHFNYKQLEAIQRWSAICRVWPWTLTYQKSCRALPWDTYSHQKWNMYIYWFSS